MSGISIGPGLYKLYIMETVTGAEMVAILIESHHRVLRTHGINPATLPIEEMARNAATILHAEIEASLTNHEDT